MAELFREYQYRKVVHVTHEQFLEEPAEIVDWTLGFLSMENEMEAERSSGS